MNLGYQFRTVMTKFSSYLPFLRNFFLRIDNNIFIPYQLKKSGFPIKGISEIIGRKKCLDIISEDFERETVDCIKYLCRKNTLFFDIGANFGYFSKIVGDIQTENINIHAFEASPKNFLLLQKTLSPYKNISIYNQAVSDSYDEVEFYEMSNPLASSMYRTDDQIDGWEASSSTKVQTIRLDKLVDELINEADISPEIIIMKIDVEGAEPKVLEGMGKFLDDPRLVIIIEYAPSCLISANYEPINLIKKLVSTNKKIYSLEKNSFDLYQNQASGWHANLVVSEESIVKDFAIQNNLFNITLNHDEVN